MAGRCNWPGPLLAIFKTPAGMAPRRRWRAKPLRFQACTTKARARQSLIASISSRCRSLAQVDGGPKLRPTDRLSWKMRACISSTRCSVVATMAMDLSSAASGAGTRPPRDTCYYYFYYYYYYANFKLRVSNPNKCLFRNCLRTMSNFKLPEGLVSNNKFEII